MQTPRLLASAALTIALFLSTNACAQKDAAPIQLFNGKDLTGWIAYTRDNSPDAAQTWGVRDGVLTDSGKPNGYLRTEKRYGNYKLTVEWRWTAAPTLGANGKPRTRNNGVLLHMQGKDQVWPQSIEAQLMEQNAGDFYTIGSVDTNEHKAARDAAIAAAGDDEAAKKRAAGNRRLTKKNPSNEKPDGEWNRYDIVCQGDTITLTVNGVEQNRATGVTVQEGHICLQSEGAPAEFRNITLTPLK
ncbi:MAG: DUF1080 domain-containing protein [Opitutaceae bacterium]|nr:DUF1080 domain-containing protein [Opitutaceae bacterium]